MNDLSPIDFDGAAAEPLLELAAVALRADRPAAEPLLRRVAQSGRPGIAEAASAMLRGDDGPGEVPESLIELHAKRRLKDIVLPHEVEVQISAFLEEQKYADRLLAHGLAPRHKALLLGPPGTGKTTLCEAVANTLGMRMFVVRYESVVSKGNGDTSRRVREIFDFVKDMRCILFFDEFDAIGLERDDNESAEMKRAVSTLLVQLDGLPPNVMLIAATNHPASLDRAAWRRFHLRIELPKPGDQDFVRFFREFFARRGHEFQTSLLPLVAKVNPDNYADAEGFCEDAYRALVMADGAITLDEAIRRVKETWHITRKKIVF